MLQRDSSRHEALQFRCISSIRDRRGLPSESDERRELGKENLFVKTTRIEQFIHDGHTDATRGKGDAGATGGLKTLDQQLADVFHRRVLGLFLKIGGKERGIDHLSRFLRRLLRRARIHGLPAKQSGNICAWSCGFHLRPAGIRR